MQGPPPNGSLTKAAINLNIASEDALPMTFCCYAELIWQMLADGKTQQSVADELGWSRGAVSNYAMLQQIDAKAWDVIATTVRNSGLQREEGAVADIATTVAFSENLLRVLPPLTPLQQHELCRLLARGRDAVERWTKDERKAEKDEQKAKAWDLWLDCLSQEAIAEEVGVPQQTISRWLPEIRKCGEWVEPPASRQHFDVWQFQSADKDAGSQSYFGALPPQVGASALQRTPPMHEG